LEGRKTAPTGNNSVQGRAEKKRNLKVEKNRKGGRRLRKRGVEKTQTISPRGWGGEGPSRNMHRRGGRKSPKTSEKRKRFIMTGGDQGE